MPSKVDRPGATVDVLPEQYVYRDTGCNYNPSCLSCPFAICLYEVTPKAAARIAAEAKKGL